MNKWRYGDRIITLDGKGYWWRTSAGSGTCWHDEENDRLIFGGYKDYGIGMHADDDHPELQKEADELERNHQEILSTLPEWDITSKVMLASEYMEEQENTIKGEITEAGGYFKRPCCICGMCHEDHVIVGRVDHALISGYVCTDCLKDGASQVKTKLIDHAEGLEAWAAELRIAANKKWSLPTYEEWQTAHDKFEEEVQRFHEGEGVVFRENKVVADLSVDDIPF